MLWSKKLIASPDRFWRLAITIRHAVDARPELTRLAGLALEGCRDYLARAGPDRGRQDEVENGSRCADCDDGADPDRDGGLPYDREPISSRTE